MEKIEEAKLRLALLKENFEYQDFFRRFLEMDKKRNKSNSAWPGLDFNKFGLKSLRHYISHPFYKYDKIIDLINPQKNSKIIPGEFADRILSRLFHDPAIVLVEVKGTEHRGLETFSSMPIAAINRTGLKPWERIYKVNLTKKKSLIKKEFESYIEQACSKNAEKSGWAPYEKRNRKEVWIHLDVWKLRKKRKSFSEISKELDITIDAAKKSFYRAYELTQDKKYNPAALRTEVWRVKKDEIKQTCADCPQRKNCADLCPDVLRYIDQDTRALQEKNLSDDSDSYIDSLINKPSKKSTNTRRE